MKINPSYIIIVLLVVCAGYLFFQNTKFEKEIQNIKISKLQSENEQINKIDSIFSFRQKLEIKRVDSICFLLSKKDSELERKNKLQDEKIRNINIPIDLLPNF